MELNHKTWKKENVVYEDIHKGYDLIIKLIPGLFNSSDYFCYVKIPNTHKYYGFDYKNIKIKTHDGLSFSEKIENDWWIGWMYNSHWNKHNKYELKDVFIDCCFVIMQLIEEEERIPNNSIEYNMSKLSKEILEEINIINSDKIDDNYINKCIICGKPILKSIVSNARLEQIKNIKAKIPNIDNKIDHVFSSDTNLALKLIGKIKKYYKEIEKIEELEKSDEQKTLCENCVKELSAKNIIELLNMYKEQCLKLNEIENRLYLEYSRYNISDDEENNIFGENLHALRESLHDKILYEYNEAMMLFISKYYYKALLSFQIILNKYKNNKYDSYKKIDYEKAFKIGLITEEKLIEYNEHKHEYEELENEYENTKREIIYEVIENINEIKKILGIG